RGPGGVCVPGAEDVALLADRLGRADDPRVGGAQAMPIEVGSDATDVVEIPRGSGGLDRRVERDDTVLVAPLAVGRVRRQHIARAPPREPFAGDRILGAGAVVVGGVP